MNKPSDLPSADFNGELIGHNDSPNETFSSVLNARLSRRSVLRGSLVTAATAVFGSVGLAACGGDNDNDSGTTPQAGATNEKLLGFQAVYGEWIDRSAKHAKLALDAGIEERKVRIAEAQGELLASVIKAILGDLDLNKKQQADAPAIVRRHLLALAG